MRYFVRSIFIVFPFYLFIIIAWHKKYDIILFYVLWKRGREKDDGE